MSNSPESGRKVSNKPKRANGRGSIYQITKSNGRKVWKAAIKDINGKLRTKIFNLVSDGRWTHSYNNLSSQFKMIVAIAE